MARFYRPVRKFAVTRFAKNRRGLNLLERLLDQKPRKKKNKVGDVKTKDGKKYRFNSNSRWERIDK